MMPRIPPPSIDRMVNRGIVSCWVSVVGCRSSSEVHTRTLSYVHLNRRPNAFASIVSNLVLAGESQRGRSLTQSEREREMGTDTR